MIHQQGTFTPLVHAHAGRTQGAALVSAIKPAEQVSFVVRQKYLENWPE
jgi:hypothetical protein